MGVTMAKLPRGDRPRERLLLHDPEALSDRELIAILLGTGLRGTSTVDLAAALVAELGLVSTTSTARPC